PVVIQAKVRGNGDGSVNGFVSFNNRREAQRSALLLQNGAVYIAWASHCDIGPYHGWLMSYNATTLAQTGVWNSSPNSGLSGFCAGGAGIAADSSSNLYMPTGNGPFDVDTGDRDYGDTLVKLGLPVNQRFQVADYFTPFDQDSLNSFDTDLGSGGAVLLPD